MKLPEFFSLLDGCGPGAVPLELLTRWERELEIDLDDVREAVRFGDDGYRRNPLREGPGYQALVLCWKPGQKSPIHDHRGSACGVRVIAGAVTETIFQRIDGQLIEGETRRLDAGGVCGSYDTDIHEIANRGSEGLVTLHVYAPPLLTMGIYTRETGDVVAWTP